MSARIIDGRAAAARLRSETAAEVRALAQRHGAAPGLAVLLVGDDPASAVYVRAKEAAAAEAGFRSIVRRLPADAASEAVIAEVAALDADPEIDGVLVQLPLPPQVDAAAALDAVSPAKDVDGFHPMNVGLLATGGGGLVPCTPQGCAILIDAELGPSLAGRTAVVLGRSNIVGKPMAQLLLRRDATVTIAHSRSPDLPALCRTADVLVVAVGRPEMARGAWIKPGAVVIDVGINRVPKPEGGTRLVGDVAFAEAAEIAAAITPAPGGVGPMTIACLLANTLVAAKRRRGWT